MEDDLIDSAQACRLLGVKPATLYAYVSRGLIRSYKRTGSRSSWYDPADLRQLTLGRSGGQAAGLAVTIESALTHVEGPVLYYRSHEALDLARTATFEQVCRLLWADDLHHEEFRQQGAPGSSSGRSRGSRAAPALGGSSGLDRLALAAALAALADPLRFDLSSPSVMHSGRALVSALVDSVGKPRHPVPPLEIGGHRYLNSIAGRLWCRMADEEDPAGVLVVNAVLVLLADHELAASTLAGRVAASTRADPYAVVSAALGALRGPLHGTVSTEVGRLFEEAVAADAQSAVASRLRGGQRIPGFGHPLYPHGDPRAVAMLAMLEPLVGHDPDRRARFAVVRAVEAASGQRSEAAPNSDFGLAAVVFVAGLPPGAGETLFAVARVAGWIAHAIEEYAAPPLRYRGRALYTGPSVESPR